MYKKLSNKEHILKSLNSEIEKKLYLIKENNFICNEGFIKSYDFKFEKIGNVSNEIGIKIGSNIYQFQKEGRLIDFIIEGNSQKRFIYSSEYLKSVLEELNIKHYSIKEDEQNNFKDISSEEIYKIFNGNNITTIYKIKASIEKIIDKFKSRFTEEIKKISDLSINAKFYFPENYNDTLDIDLLYNKKYKNMYKDIEKNIWYNNLVYFIGPKGNSKSIFLMYLFQFKNKISFYPLLYINYKRIAHLDLKERKNIFNNEIVYLFFEENKLREFLKGNYYKIIKKEKDFLLALKIFLQDLINIYKNTFKKRIIVIIDNFDEENEQESEKMENIISLVKQNAKQIKLFLSGHCKYINKKIKPFFVKIYGTSGEDIINYNAIIENNQKIKSLPAFYFRKNINDSELEQVLLKEEMEYCKKFNINGMYYSVINCGKKLESKKLFNYFCLLPIEYLNFKIEEEKYKCKYITFSFHNFLFLKAVKISIKNRIKNLIKEHSFNSLIKEEGDKEIFNEIFKEKLLSLLISYNGLNLENWKLNENNILEVERIADFKTKEYPKTKNAIEIGLPIIITQKDLDENYDLLILFPDEGINSYNYIGYMIKISLNKTKDQIEKIKNDLDENSLDYEEGIRQFVGKDIRLGKLDLLFIFDKSTQDNYLSRKIFVFYEDIGCKYCIKNNIKFYLFSIEKNCLMITFDNNEFIQVSEFGNFNMPLKNRWDKIFSFFLDENEINFINSKIKNDIKKGSIRVLSGEGVAPDKIDEDIVYVLKNEEETYYLINKKKYDQNFKEIQKINENTLFSHFIFSDYSEPKSE